MKLLFYHTHEDCPTSKSGSRCLLIWIEFVRHLEKSFSTYISFSIINIINDFSKKEVLSLTTQKPLHNHVLNLVEMIRVVFFSHDFFFF